MAETSAQTVKLISSEGHEFIVDRKAAMVSGTIKSMLGGPGKKSERELLINLRFILFFSLILIFLNFFFFIDQSFLEN
jgi:hypothetical protein